MVDKIIEPAQHSSDAECSVFVYTECDYCDGLFPHYSIESHMRLGHKRFGSPRIKRERTGGVARRFAVTELDAHVRTQNGRVVLMNNTGNNNNVKVNRPIVNTRDVDDDTDSDSSMDFTPKMRSARRPLRVGLGPSGVLTVPNFGLELKGAPNKAKRKVNRALKDFEFITPQTSTGAPLSLSELMKMKVNANAERLPKKRRKHERLMPPPPTPDDELKLTMADFPQLPAIFDAELLSTQPPETADVDSVETLTLRCNLQSKEHIKEWLNAYMARSGTNWLLNASGKTSTTMRHYQQFKCRHANHSPMRKISKKIDNLDCQAYVTFSVRQDDCCIIKLSPKHSHATGEGERRGVLREVAREFEAYFAAGMKPTQALNHHIKELKARNDYKADMLHTVPKPSQVGTLYKKYISECKKTKAVLSGLLPQGPYNPDLEDESMLD